MPELPEAQAVPAQRQLIHHMVSPELELLPQPEAPQARWVQVVVVRVRQMRLMLLALLVSAAAVLRV